MAISAASPSDGATTTASSPALQQHEVAPVEMSEREKFLLDMNGDRAQPVISIDEQFSFQPVDLCSIAPQDFWWWKTF
jgi:glutaredoxin